ncbi:uncharacterized protein [Asterias amurensis]
MPMEHLQKSEASKRSKFKHAAVLLDLWSSSDEDETARSNDGCILVPDTPSPERKLHPIVEHQLPRSGRESPFDIGESILHQLKRPRKRSSQDSTKELRLPQETEESTLFQTTRKPSKLHVPPIRLSRVKPPKDKEQTSVKSFVFKVDQTARNSERDCSKNSGRKIFTKNVDSSQAGGVITVEKTHNSASIHGQNPFLGEGRINSGIRRDTFFREQNDPAIPHSINEIERSQKVKSVISNNSSHNKHRDVWSRPTSEVFSNSESRSDIGRQATSYPSSRPQLTQKFRRLEGLDKVENDSSGSSSDSDSIFSSTFPNRSSSDNRQPLARRLQNKLGSRQNDALRSISQLPDVVASVNNNLAREEEKVTSPKHNGFMKVLQRMSTVPKDSNIRQQFGQNKRSLKVDNPPRTKKARILPVSWSMSSILNSSSNALERRHTKFEQGSAGSAKQTHDTSDKVHRNDNHSDQKQMDLKLFGSTSSTDGDETEEDDDRIQDRQDDQVILIDSGQGVGEETHQAKNTTQRPYNPDSRHMSMSLRASCSQGPSDNISQKRVAHPPGRDEGVILIDITQSADRGAMSGQTSPEFQSNFSPCQRNSKTSLMSFKQKAPLNREDHVPSIKIRSNVAWDDDVVHINTIQSTERDDSSEPESPTISIPILASGISSSPSRSPVFFRCSQKEITPKKSDITLSNNQVPQNLTGFGSPSQSPGFMQRFSRETTTRGSDDSSPQHRLRNHDRKQNNTRRNLSMSPDDNHMIVNLTDTDHPNISGHTSRTHKQKWTDSNPSLVLAGQVSNSALGNSARGSKSDGEEVRRRPSQGRTDTVTVVSSSSYPIGFNPRLEIQDITLTTPRASSLNIGSYGTSSNQVVNIPGSGIATRNLELEVGELGDHQTSPGICSNSIDERHLELPSVGPDDGSRVSRHKSKRTRKESKKDKDIAKPPTTDVGAMNSEGHRSKHRKEHKSSKHKRKSREKRSSGRPESPDVIELVRQMENDEAMAKQLQEEFDAEANRLAEASSNDQPILIHNIDGPGHVPSMPVLPLFPGAHNTAFPNQRGTNQWEMRWRDDLVDNNPVNAAMMLEMDRFLVDNMEGHIGQHIHLPPPRQRNRGQRRGRGRGRRNPHNMQSPMANGADYETLWNLAESVGPAISKGLPESSINYLPTFLYTPGQSSEEKECSICMGDYETGENMRRLPCFHFYHAVCIDKWLKENRICPVCREEVNFNPVNFH